MRLSTEIRRAKFHFVDMIRDRTRADLKEARVFRKVYVEVVCRALEARFSNNDIIFVFSVLNPSNMPSKMVGLYLWGVTELEFLLKQYGVKKYLEDKIFSPFINSNVFIREFFNFKL
jgi:hypothetical protein